MKKILSIILTMVLLLSVFSFMPVQAQTLRYSEEEMTDLLDALGIVTNTGSSEPTEGVKLTRAEMATLVVRLIGENEYAANDHNYYADIEEGFWGRTAINILAERGFFTVPEDRLFRPTDYVTVAEACKVLLKVTGHDAIAEARGGFPGGYTRLAGELQLLDNLEADGSLSKKAFTHMLYTCLHIHVLTPEIVTKNDMQLAEDKEETVMSLYHKVYKTSGQVTAADHTGLNGEVTLQENTVMIDQTLYKTDGVDADFYEYLGLKLNVYYHRSNVADDPEIVTFSVASGNEVLELTHEQYEGLRDADSYYELSYRDSGDTLRRAKLDKSVAVLKNGAAVLENVPAAFVIAKGSYKLIDSNNDGSYDVAVISDMYDMVIGMIDNRTETTNMGPRSDNVYYVMRGPVGATSVIYDKYDAALAVDVTAGADKVIKLKDADGKAITMEELAVGDVLTVIRSANGKYVEIYKGSQTVSGVLQAVTRGEDAEITVDGQTYPMTAECEAHSKIQLSPGMTGNFKLNFMGEVAYYEKAEDETDLLGYLYQISYDNAGLDDSVRLRLFGQDGNVHTLDCAKTVTLDGSQMKKQADIANALLAGGTSLAPRVVRYRLNADGAVKLLDTETRGSAEDGATLTRIESVSNVSYRPGPQKFGNLSIFNSNTVVFVVPTDATLVSGGYDEDAFAVKTISALGSDHKVNAIAYKTNEANAYDDVLVVKTDIGVKRPTFTNISLLTESIKTVVDEKTGDTVYQVVVFEKGKSVTYYTADQTVFSGYNLTPGDLVWFKFDIHGRIAGVRQVIYSIRNDVDLDNACYSVEGAGEAYTENTSTNAEFRVAHLYATKMIGSVLYGGYTKGAIDMVYDLGSNAITVYDESAGTKGKCFKGAVTDIVDYEKGGDVCSDVWIHTRQQTIMAIYVYK